MLNHCDRQEHQTPTGYWHKTGVPQVGHTRWNPFRVPVDLLTFHKHLRLWCNVDSLQRTWLWVQIISRKTHKSSHKCTRGHMRTLQTAACMLPLHTAWTKTRVYKSTTSTSTTDILLYMHSSEFVAYFFVKWLETLTRCQFFPLRCFSCSGVPSVGRCPLRRTGTSYQLQQNQRIRAKLHSQGVELWSFHSQ